jgi:2-dehydropantoate 2-reductase
MVSSHLELFATLCLSAIRICAYTDISVSGHTVRNSIPDISAENLPPYDYIILTTKNCPDIPPSIASLVSPALPASNTHTVLVLIQNGLNIEKPFLVSHPHTLVLSGVSLIGSAEPAHGVVVQEDKDRLLIGAFPHPSIDPSTQKSKAEEFVTIYGSGGKTSVQHSVNVEYDRWRKLVYNACLNPICAITGLDSGRVRLADGALDGLVRPAMREVVQAAKGMGVELGGEEVVEWMIGVDPLELYLQPSMLMDVDKVCGL